MLRLELQLQRPHAVLHGLLQRRHVRLVLGLQPRGLLRRALLVRVAELRDLCRVGLGHELRLRRVLRLQLPHLRAGCGLDVLQLPLLALLGLRHRAVVGRDELLLLLLVLDPEGRVGLLLLLQLCLQGLHLLPHPIQVRRVLLHAGLQLRDVLLQAGLHLQGLGLQAQHTLLALLRQLVLLLPLPGLQALQLALVVRLGAELQRPPLRVLGLRRLRHLLQFGLQGLPLLLEGGLIGLNFLLQQFVILLQGLQLLKGQHPLLLLLLLLALPLVVLRHDARGLIVHLIPLLERLLLGLQHQPVLLLQLLLPLLQLLPLGGGQLVAALPLGVELFLLLLDPQRLLLQLHLLLVDLGLAQVHLHLVLQPLEAGRVLLLDKLGHLLSILQRILIDDRVGLDLLRPVCEPQRHQRLRRVHQRGAGGDQEDRPGVAPEGLLQQLRQRGVPERDLAVGVLGALHDGLHAIAEVQQRLVDGTGLREVEAVDLGILHALAARQIDQRDLAGKGLVGGDLFDVDLEQRVGPAGGVVQLVRRRDAVGLPTLDQLRDAAVVLHLKLAEPGHVEPGLEAAADGQPLFVVQQVEDVLQVHLDHAHVHLVRHVLALVLGRLDVLEQGLADPRDHALRLGVPRPVAVHGVGLPGPGLAVREDRGVEALEGVVDQLGPQDLVHLLLVGVGALARDGVIGPEAMIEREQLFLSRSRSDLKGLVLHVHRQF
mmetsp:Transcript_65560/g.109208  ORF Transcript_65560/g.109208 Transcript_65560/m.109208 type:complete len:711 (-) Transcript_65560:281-2413(-)